MSLARAGRQPGVSAPSGADDAWLRAAGARLQVPPAGWRARSACATADHELFVGELDAHEEATAKAICAGCQVQDACLAYSITHGVQYGVWGGMNGAERRSLQRIWANQLEPDGVSQAHPV